MKIKGKTHLYTNTVQSKRERDEENQEECVLKETRLTIDMDD